MSLNRGSLFYKPKPRTKEIRRKRWNWPVIIWEAVKKSCMVIGAVVLFSAFTGAVISTKVVRQSAPSLPGEMILFLDLKDGLGETSRSPSLSDPFPFHRPTVRVIVEALDNAREDEDVHGLVVSVAGGGLSSAHVQEVRAAIKRFRASGKFAKIYATSYDGFGSGLGVYYLASAFDEIWMQPVGMLSIAGIGFEMPYARAALDKIGVRPDFYQREEYKGAMENMTARKMSGPSREMLGSIVKSLSGQMLSEISADRNMAPATLKKYIDQGILTGPEALEAGLIDHLDYADVLMSQAREKITGEKDQDKPDLVSLSHYHASKQAKILARGEEEIAIVYAVGAIVPEAHEGTAGADEISAAIKEAAKDKKIKTIVLRINSPGGSPTASETIRREIVRAKEKGKKVIVSMGPVAASGGYWIAADADRIFALPATLTGSIGVVMGKFSLQGVWDKVGVHWDDISWGKNAGMWSFNRNFSDSEGTRMNALIESVYQAFLTRVSEGRKMPKAEVRKIAKGRAWTGQQAQEIGLVDELGGLDDALDYTARDLGLKDRSELKIVVLPRPQRPIEQLLEMLGGQVALGKFMGKFFGAHSETLDRLEPFLTKMENSAREDFSVYDGDLEFVR
ncbi:MAG: signal peptide peptidase SppA [Alphaproteobacteria bacterium]|nr:signal peptide peptidase SppA [Alphaproteobacteria bacterium]